MEAVKARAPDVLKADELGDESFMSAADLRKYMADMEMARASKEADRAGGADKAREKLIKELSEPVERTPERVHEVVQVLTGKLRAAADSGQTELMVMRFPVALCTDKGRAINNMDEGWPDTLTGRPRQAYEFWQDHLKHLGYKLSAMIIEWPAGLPGDVGFFLKWGQKR